MRSGRVLLAALAAGCCAMLAALPAVADPVPGAGAREGEPLPVSRVGYEMPATDMAAAVGVDPAHLVDASWAGSAAGFFSARARFSAFPREGESYLVLSTGDAARVLGGTRSELLSTVLGNRLGADRNDLTQVTLELVPPPAARCLAFDFLFLSEGYPEYVGSRYNDVFTAELGESFFTMHGSQVVAPHNVAYDGAGNLISVNTVLGLTTAPDGTRMDGATAPLVAVAPVQPDLESGTVTLILSVQDIGDSVVDSAVLVDDLRWLQGEHCARTVAALTDSDGDGLPDLWETEGIDYDGDGVPEVDLPAMGADPHRADVFLQIDWMERPRTCRLFGTVWCQDARSFAPQSRAVRDVVRAFADAPHVNLDGSTGITLHVSLGGPVPWHEGVLTARDGGYDWSLFEELKQAHLDPLLRDTTHWVLYGDRAATGLGISGISRGIPAADFLVTSGAWPDGFSPVEERGTLMHELGHNLGLMHGGPDHTTYQNDPAYRSVMNYLYQLSGIGAAETLDYSRWSPHVDWDHLVFTGGSIGDLGERVPVNFIPGPIDEMTPEDQVPLQGDGVMVLVGPDFMAATGTQHLVVRVTNRAALPTTYDIEIVSPDGVVLGTTRTTVPGETQQLVTVAVDPSTLTLGEHELEFLLYSHTLRHEEISSRFGRVKVFVPADHPDLVTLLREDLVLVEASPDLEGFEQAVIDVAWEIVGGRPDATGPAAAPEPTATPVAGPGDTGPADASADDGTVVVPGSGLGATGAAVVAALVAAVLAAAAGVTLVVRVRRARRNAEPVPDGPSGL